jgi:hypothetical protein
MSKPFDATLNNLIDDHVDDWGTFLGTRAGIPPGRVVPLDTNLSVTAQADKLFRIEGPRPALLHLEFESSGRLGLPEELLRYNVLARSELHLPVHSVVVLLRPKSNASDLTGELSIDGADSRDYLRFRYTVVRVWQESMEALFAAGAGVAPLGVLTNEASADLSAAFDRLAHRLGPPFVPPAESRSILGSSFVLCGLRYNAERIAELYRRVSMSLSVQDSTSIQFLRDLFKSEGLKEGKAEGKAESARALVLRLGEKRFGKATPVTISTINGITDFDRLARMAERVIDGAGWPDLLSTE